MDELVDSHVVEELTAADVVWLVDLAERLIGYEPKHWYGRVVVTTQDKVRLATLAIVIAMYKELHERRP